MKNLLHISCALLCTLIIPEQGLSQVSNYAFTETTGTYQAIILDNSVASWSGTISSNSSNSQTISTPFEFCLGGNTITANNDLTMFHDGWAVFGNPSTTQATRTAPLTYFNNVLSIFGTDLITTGTSSYGARVEGSAPNRVLVMQWGQLYFGDSNQSPFITTNYWERAVNGHSNDRLHFQIRLYETTNVIEFCYLISNPRTTSNGNLSNDVQVGLRGARGLPSGSTNTMFFNNVRNNVTNKPSFVIPASPGNGSTKAGPGVGTIFRWTPIGSLLDPPSSYSGCYFSPLPVELSEFIAERGVKVNNIMWTTVSERNSDYFIVERSSNGADWEAIGRAEAAGNSTSSINYMLEDRSFESVVNYYRLTQVDFDGKSNVYNMISVDNRLSKMELLKTVNLMGQEVGVFYKGLVIEMYSDGTSQKIYR